MAMSNSDDIMVKVKLDNVLNEQKCEYEWTIHYTEHRRLRLRDNPTSPTFYSHPTPDQTPVGWCLMIDASNRSISGGSVGYQGRAHEVSLLLHNNPINVVFGGHVSLHVKTSQYSRHFDGDFTTVSCSGLNGIAYRFPDPVHFCHSDVSVTLTCSIAFYKLSEINRFIVSDQKVTVPLAEPTAHVPGKRFAALYLEKKHSDVTLCVNGNCYPAHKCILVGCSPVFEAMFDHDMKESNQNVVEIKDIDEKAFLDALRFMYTGQIEDSEEVICDLLPVADRYDIKELKEVCGDALSGKLSVKTVIQISLIADSCNLPDLKKYAIEFIKKNSNDVMAAMSPEEKEEIKSSPNLTKDLLDSGLKL